MKVRLVARLRAVTFAFATEAALASETVPSISEEVCACANEARNKSESGSKIRSREFMVWSSLGHCLYSQFEVRAGSTANLNGLYRSQMES